MASGMAQVVPPSVFDTALKISPAYHLLWVSSVPISLHFFLKQSLSISINISGM